MNALLLGVALGAAGYVVMREASARAALNDAGNVGDETGAGSSWSGDIGDAIASVLPSEITDFGAELNTMLDDAIYGTPDAAALAAIAREPNVRAFLDMIPLGEGTNGALGYQTIVGGSTFEDMSKHPGVRVKIAVAGKTITSSAAGRYQILASTWSEVQRALRLPDFSPTSQDIAAVFLIRRRGALDDVRAGRLQDAIRKCAREWASLPGSPYGQRTISLAAATEAYYNAGGTIA